MQLKQSLQKPSMQKDIFLLAILFSFVIVIAKYSWSIISGDYGPFIPTFDFKQYVNLAENKPAISPWKYRMLTPFLASLLPFETVINFFVLNLGITTITIVLYYNYLKTFNFTQEQSMIGVSIFIVSQMVLYNFFFPMADSMTHALLIAGCYLIRKEKQYWPIVILCVGVGNHEMILVLLPIIIIHAKQPKKISIFCGIPIMFLIILRMYAGFSFGATGIYLDLLLKNGITTLLFVGQTFLFVWFGIYNAKKDRWLWKSYSMLIIILPMTLLASHIARILFLLHPVLIPSYLYFLKPGDQKLDTT